MLIALRPVNTTIRQNDEYFGFVKGRSIHEATRVTELVIEHARRDTGAIICAYDFAKAFDSIDHAYLTDLLTRYGYPVEFVNMIKVLYSGAESAVINGGQTTRYFPLERSCRQGDALSPYLFILAINPLIHKLKKDKDIKGVGLCKERVKIIKIGIGIESFKSNYYFKIIWNKKNQLIAG